MEAASLQDSGLLMLSTTYPAPTLDVPFISHGDGLSRECFESSDLHRISCTKYTVDPFLERANPEHYVFDQK